MWTVQLPLAVQLSTNKWFMLNLNHYRNTHYRQLNQAKELFTQRVKPLLKDLPKLDRILIAYSLFTPNKRNVDTANVCSIVDKFFSDTLVEAGKLEDDNCRILPIVAFRFGGVDSANPRVEATIHSIGPNHDITIIEG
jgi:hypothetical protein